MFVLPKVLFHHLTINGQYCPITPSKSNQIEHNQINQPQTSHQSHISLITILSILSALLIQSYY